MAFSFAATPDYLFVASVPVSVAPLTMACWFNYSGAVTNRTLLSIETADSQNGWRLIASLNSTVRLATRSSNVLVSQINTTATWSANTWTHACATTASSADRTVYMNGANAVTDTTSVTAPTTVTRTAIGANVNSGTPMNGLLAEVGIWNVALTADEVQALGRGISPRLVRPASLRVYVPLLRNLVEPIGNLSFTTTGSTPVADHPRIYP